MVKIYCYIRCWQVRPLITLTQACQTQTTSRAAKATKNAKGDAKVSKYPKRATFYKINDWKWVYIGFKTFLILSIVIFIQN